MRRRIALFDVQPKQIKQTAAVRHHLGGYRWMWPLRICADERLQRPRGGTGPAMRGGS